MLVGLILPGDAPRGTRYDPLAELASLAEAAGAQVVGRTIQKRGRIDSATYIGSGKVEELAAYADEKDADVIIFDNELTPSQIRELDKACKRRVIDRTELILDIFASRARTATARLQVELAQLEYTSPRLRGMWTHLERIAGAGGGTTAGAVGAIGTRGPGERQIEIDRRIVQKRVTFLRSQLAHIDQRRVREVKARGDYFTVSLVGYTNAGKSTLMNALTGTETYVADKLFATLDTRTRRWNFGGGQLALLSDTVGFVRDLPHQLVASFRATLEETIHSDLLLHVVDASAYDAIQQYEAVRSVLTELECDTIPSLVVLNKLDAVEDVGELAVLRAQLSEVAEISARTGAGLPELCDRVLAVMRDRFVRLILESSSANGRLISYISQHGHVLGREYVDGRVRMDVRLPRGEVARVVKMGASVVESAADASAATD